MFDPVKAKREEILQVAKRHGVTRVRVFGSMARGDAVPESDVDLLVDVGPNPSPWFPGGLVADLEQLLGRPVQVITERGLDVLLRDRVLAEAVPLWRTNVSTSATLGSNPSPAGCFDYRAVHGRKKGIFALCSGRTNRLGGTSLGCSSVGARGAAGRRASHRDE